MTHLTPDHEHVQSVVEDTLARLPIPDAAFIRRVWRTRLDVYQERIRAVGFTGMSRVLDAGGGTGQWSVGLASLNEQVISVDMSLLNVRCAQRVLGELRVDNVFLSAQSIDALAFEDSCFDGIFCYGVLQFTRHERTLRDFARVLRPGGCLYLSTNTYGWHLKNIVRPPPSAGYVVSPRRHAYRSVVNSLRRRAGGVRRAGEEIVLPRHEISRLLVAEGFADVQIGGEGKLRRSGDAASRPFFPSAFAGLPAVYDVLARRT